MFSGIMINRIGKSKESFMVTNRIIQNIYPNTPYKVLIKNLLPLQETKSHVINSINNDIYTIPKYIDINCEWNNKRSIVNNNSNLLGNFGKVLINNEINIPINTANKGNVSFYGAKLFNIFEILYFKSKDTLPLTEMIIGKDYVKNFIEQKEYGGGQYLEYHDNPHYHSPMQSDNKGYYILGKKINNNKIRISAFSIPYLTGIYTPGFVIHSDANLVGKWMVVYSKTNIYSTVLMRDNDDNCTKINFV